MYKDTITLFNRLKKPTGDLWYPTILHDVNLNIDKAEVVKKYGPDAADNCVLNVTFTKSGDDILVGGKMWIPPREWQKAQERGYFVKWVPEKENYTGGEYDDAEPYATGDEWAGGIFNPWDVNAGLVPVDLDYSDYVTFAAGSAFDFFWAGEWTGGSVVYDNNYGDQTFYDYMLANYDFVFAITSVGFFSVLPHFEVVGR